MLCKHGFGTRESPHSFGADAHAKGDASCLMPESEKRVVSRHGMVNKVKQCPETKDSSRVRFRSVVVQVITEPIFVE